jgi:general secretion pathway protein G
MKSCFTLIELIVVITIIAILAAIISPTAFKAVEKSRISATLADYKTIKTAATSYYSDVGDWPANNTQGTGLINDDGSAGWDGPYLDKWPAKAQWGSGEYTWYKDTAFDGDTDEDRYIGISSVPYSSAQKIDEAIDGTADGTAGWVRYTHTSGSGTVNILISEGY